MFALWRSQSFLHVHNTDIRLLAIHSLKLKVLGLHLITRVLFFEKIRDQLHTKLQKTDLTFLYETDLSRLDSDNGASKEPRTPLGVRILRDQFFWCTMIRVILMRIIPKKHTQSCLKIQMRATVRALLVTEIWILKSTTLLTTIPCIECT